jgi:hypothetical protein
MSYCIYTDAEGTPLVYAHAPHTVPILTVSVADKWYTPYLVNPDGSVTEATLHDLEEVTPVNECAWGGSTHVWNPHSIQALCVKHGWHLCMSSLQFIIGRWEHEYKDSYRYMECFIV